MYYFKKENTFLEEFNKSSKLKYNKIGNIKPIFWIINFLICFTLQVVPELIILIILITIEKITGNKNLIHDINTKILNNLWITWSFLISKTSLVILSFFMYIKLIERRPFSSIGFKVNNKLKKYFKGAIIAILMQLTYWITILFFGWGEISSQPINSTIAIGSSAIKFVLLFLIFFVVQGASEEIAVRGWILPVLSKHYKVYTSIIISSLFFGFLHFLNPNLSILSIINLTLYGIFAALYALYDDGLWGICAQHSIWNWFMGNVLGLPVSGMIIGKVSIIETKISGPEWVTGGKFGPEGGIIVSIILSISIVILINLLIKKDILVSSKKYSNVSTKTTEI
ncbi:CPBP family intramembrane glutamic endopeptidase [Defluviitalea phaphyphila]|uniref:CPBP family intramembrane glutamic endopeptidase n=1 Tax=Defluviitalea phaphyphila TaxID=1473580 RepID=UPI000730C24A|nr:type II CAAX endopeptidase family protein [Defluviitalea phaphyphila]